ncbi:MAG: pentapeptide repeat-containing protein [Gammaproteobacteria bacterium]|nr:pentapeptide repeat-containing protein [Gammaproteobacteria bacterium]
MANNKTLWYIRKNGVIKGPFTSAFITNNLALGRLRMTDEISQNQSQWHVILNLPELHPSHNDEHQLKAKKQLDERDGFDRRETITDSVEHAIERQPQDRHQVESDQEIEHRRLHTLLMQKLRHQKQHTFWPMVATFSILGAAIVLALIYPSQLPVPLPNCTTPAAPEVNWNNCLKPKIDLQHKDLTAIQLRNSQLIGSNLMNSKLNGADLAYADLRFTNLSYSQLQNALLLGANLKQSDLSNADLTDADLSFADLRDANIGGSIFKNTRFDNAIWTNGQVCAINSIDRCIVVSESTP